MYPKLKSKECFQDLGYPKNISGCYSDEMGLTDRILRVHIIFIFMDLTVHITSNIKESQRECGHSQGQCCDFSLSKRLLHTASFTFVFMAFSVATSRRNSRTFTNVFDHFGLHGGSAMLEDIVYGWSV